MQRACSMLALLLGLLSGQCHCSRQTPDDTGVTDSDTGDTNPDSAADADIDGDTDADTDLDHVDADAEIDSDPEPDVEALELCGEDDRPAWSWHPYECSDYPQPPDCCASCRLLTCRMLATPYDIWDDLVVYRARASVGIVDLSTGEDRVVFPSQVVEEEYAVGYLDPRISSRYVVALMHSESYIDGEWRFGQEAVVARNLSDLSGPEIVLARYYYEDGLTPIFIDVYEEWATWSVPSPSTGYHDLVLCNIETGEQRVIVREHSGYSVSIPAIWGDRVVWGTSDQVLEEYRISTGETRTVFHSTTEMGNVGGVSIWENYVTFYSFGHQAVLVNLDTGETQQPLSLESTKESVSINNGRIVWTDFRGAEPPAGMHIYLYSLRTGREYVLNPSAIGGSTPLIFDRNVVWGGQQDTGVVGRWVTRIGDI